MHTWKQDLRFGGRMLRRSPAHSLFLILTIALGVGAVTAMFTVVDDVLLRPLPFYGSQRHLAVWGRVDPESG
jgi:hypothetical protein